MEEKKFIAEKGLFWQKDGEDGMEISIGGHGFRVTINSYMAAEAATLSKIAHWKNDNQAQALETEACRIKENMFKYLWDPKAEFLKVLSVATCLVGKFPWICLQPNSDWESNSLSIKTVHL